MNTTYHIYMMANNLTLIGHFVPRFAAHFVCWLSYVTREGFFLYSFSYDLKLCLSTKKKRSDVKTRQINWRESSKGPEENLKYSISLINHLSLNNLPKADVRFIICSDLIQAEFIKKSVVPLPLTWLSHYKSRILPVLLPWHVYDVGQIWTWCNE